LRVVGGNDDAGKAVTSSKRMKDVDKRPPVSPFLPETIAVKLPVGKVVRIAASRPFGGARPVRNKFPAASKARSDWKSHVGHYGPFEVDVAAGQVKKVEWKCYTGMQ